MNWYKVAIENSQSLYEDIKKLIPLILIEVQKLYDEWEEDSDFGEGGICDAVSEEISSVLNYNIKDIDTIEGGQDGDDHSWIIAYRGKEAFGVDISPYVYEIGGGYSWKKIPNVVFKKDDVDIFPIDIKDLALDQYKTKSILAKNNWYKTAIKYVPLENKETHGPVFKSYLKEKLLNKIPKTTNSNQILQILNSKDFGVNRAEIEWSGLLEWLVLEENNNRKIYSEELANFLDDPAYTIKEEHPISGNRKLEDDLYWDSEPSPVEPSIQEINYYVSSNLESKIEELKEESPGEDYIEEDGEEIYDETVYKNKARRILEQEAREDSFLWRYDEANYGYYIIYNKDDSTSTLYNKDGTGIFESDRGNSLLTAKEYAKDDAREEHGKPEIQFEYEQYISDGEYKNYNELLFTFENKQDKSEYGSPHFNNKNILAHVRFDTRTDSNGNEMLFIEEIQSDLNQTGRKEGYFDPKEFKRIKEEAERLLEEKNKLIPQIVDFIYNFYQERSLGVSLNEVRANFLHLKDVILNKFPELEEMKTLRSLGDKFSEISEQYNSYEKELGKMRMQSPTNPLQNTEAWVSLVFKRMLRLAAESNINQIAWTRGETQAERYNLSKFFESIDVVHHLEKGNNNYGSLSLNAKRSDGSPLVRHGIRDFNELDQYVGFEIRTKIENSTPEIKEDGKYYHLDKKDLDLGESGGMYNFYDKIIPQVVGKIAKKNKTEISRSNIIKGKDRHFEVARQNRKVAETGDWIISYLITGNIPEYLLDNEHISNQNRMTSKEKADYLIKKIFGVENEFPMDKDRGYVEEDFIWQVDRKLEELAIAPRTEEVYSMAIPEQMRSDILNSGQYIYSNKNSWYKIAQEMEDKKTIEVPPVYKETIDMLSATAESIGLRAYAVGGFVRDLLIGRQAKDLDIMVDVDNPEVYHRNIKPIYDEAIKNPIQFVQSQITGAKTVTDVNKFRIEQSDHRPEFFRILCEIDYIDKSTKKPKKISGEPFETSLNPSYLFAKQFDRTVPRGEAFGIFAVMTDVGEVEIAYPRTETYDAGSRKPRTEMGTLAEDANRRDTSMNALFLDLKNFTIIDGSGHGLEDIKNKEIKITDPSVMDEIFAADPLRILRVIRQSAQLGFTIDPTILEYIKQNPHLMAMKGTEKTWDDETFEAKLSSERIQEEIKKIMSLPNAHNSIALMDDLGILNHAFLLPEEAEDWRFDQVNPYHYENVWDHTITVMKKLDEFLEESGDQLGPQERFELNMSALLHDVGKLIPETGYQNKLDKEGNVTRRTFVGHPDESTKITKNILSRLKFPNSVTNRVSNLVSFHDMEMKFAKSGNLDYMMMKTIKDIGPQIYELLKLAIADRRAHIDGSNDSSELEKTLQELPTKYSEYESKTKTFISGDEIQKIINANRGKWMGLLISFLEECQMQGQINSKEEAEIVAYKLSIICKKINKAPDEWISQFFPYLLSMPNDEASIINWLSSMANRFKKEDNKPLIEKIITGNDIIPLAEEMGIVIKGPKMGQILSDAFSAQMEGQFVDEEGNLDKVVALNWLVQRLEQERLNMPQTSPLPEENGEGNMNITSSNKWYKAQPNGKMFIFSERNQSYSSPTSLEEDSIENMIDVIIDELEQFLYKNKNEIDWDRVRDSLNDDEFLNELKEYFEEDPNEMYASYIIFRDESIQEHVASILDSEIIQAQAPDVNLGLLGASDFDTSQLDGVFGSDVVNAAKQLALSYNGDLFKNIVKVEQEGGDFLGVFKPGVNQQIVENLKNMEIINEEQAQNILSGGGLTFNINPDRVFSEKEGLKANIVQNMANNSGIDQNDSDFQAMMELDDKHLLTLILSESFVHESVHASGNPEQGYPGEGEAESAEKGFLNFAIQQINSERQSKGIDPLEIGIK